MKFIILALIFGVLFTGCSHNEENKHPESVYFERGVNPNLNNNDIAEIKRIIKENLNIDAVYLIIKDSSDINKYHVFPETKKNVMASHEGFLFE